MKMPPITDFERPCTPRPDMPQINEADLLPLLVFLAGHNVNVEATEMDTAQLVFHQKVYPDRIPPPRSAELRKPLLVAADGYILDGNHRAAAHRRDGTRPIVFRLDRSFLEAIAALFRFPRTYVYERP